MKRTLGQRLIELVNRYFGPRNRYFETMMRSPEEAFEYSVRAGEVVYAQFAGWNDLTDQVVLDFGCGGGGKTVFYAGQGARRTIGVDVCLDTHMAEDYGRRHGLAVQFEALESDGRIPLDDDSCDVIINSSVLEHVMDLSRTLAELRRVLKPGGRLLSRWHPYRSRYGAHLWSAIGVPFAHLLFRQADLVQVYYRSLLGRYGEIPESMQRLGPESRSFDDLTYSLNRLSIRRMRRMVEASGFDICARRRYLKTTQAWWSRWLPEALVDYFVDYEAQICLNGKRARVTTAARVGREHGECVTANDPERACVPVSARD